MAMQYRIRYYSNGGPVNAGNPKGWPTASKPYRSLLTALRAYRSAMNDPRVGTELGIGLQYRLFSSEPWHNESPTTTDRYAHEMNMKDWINSDGSVFNPSTNDVRNRSGRQPTKRELAIERRRARQAMDLQKLDTAIRKWAETGRGLRVGKKFGHVTVTNIGDHTVNYVTKDGYTGTVQIPFMTAHGGSNRHHKALLAKYGY